MDPASARPRYEAIDHGDLLMDEWRVTQLTRLEIPCRWPRPRPKAPPTSGSTPPQPGDPGNAESGSRVGSTDDRSARTSRRVHPLSRRKQRTKDGHRLLQSHPCRAPIEEAAGNDT
jgi:hypothetical protein